MFQDIRFACRRLLKTPGFTLVAVLTLALGIGLNTSMFSLMNALLLRPLPYPDGANLVRVYVTTPQADDWALTAPVFRQVRESGAGFARLAAFGWWGASLTEPGRPAEMLVAVSAAPEGMTVILEFPDRPTAEAWYASPAYQAILGHRLASHIGLLVAISSADHQRRRASGTRRAGDRRGQSRIRAGGTQRSGVSDIGSLRGRGQ